MCQKLVEKWTTPLTWGLLGALLLGGIGAAYGAWWYYSPESRETYIREQLSQPHFDSPRYVAGIVAWRYRTLGSLIGQYAFGSAVAGFAVGVLAGKVREETQLKSLADPPKVLPVTLLELLVVGSIVVVLISLLSPINRGLVYHEGKDQFHWLMQLEFGKEPEQRQAVAAMIVLLEKPPFPCRGTIIPALAKCGPLAEPALPLLETLTRDEEPPIREAAKNAMQEIQNALTEPPSFQDL